MQTSQSEGSRATVFILMLHTEQRNCSLISSETNCKRYKGYIMQNLVDKDGKLSHTDLSKPSNPSLSSRQLSDPCC